MACPGTNRVGSLPLRLIALLLLLVPYGATAETIQGKVIRIANGDTLTILDARKREHTVRLAEIDAPESKQAFGAQSRQSLSALCFKKTAQIEWREKDRNGRYIGQVICAGVNANAEQVRRGFAWVSPRFTQPGSPLYEIEAYARFREIGLWADPRSMPPWEWRARKAKSPAKSKPL
jgi:endonuclease YncB( thermonuclease family)